MFKVFIGGSSGVGKTTLANLVKCILPEEETVHICGDSYHKWERGDKNWELYTHLDPEANRLDKCQQDLKALDAGYSVHVRPYNHDTGMFDLPVLITPPTNLILDGLHVLHGSMHDRVVGDIEIFVETDDELKKEWKIKRDTAKRGYTKEQVIAAIEARKEDEVKYITPQRNEVDFVANFTEDANGEVNLKMEYVSEWVTRWRVDYMIQIQNLYNAQKKFLKCCHHISLSDSLAQSKGGNVSVKFDNKIMITSSGVSFKDVSMSGGFNVCERIKIFRKHPNETSYLDIAKKSVLYNKKNNPSMELGFHANMPQKVIMHTHPIYVNAIICSNEGKEIIQKLFGDECDYVNYVTPGYELSNKLDLPRYKDVFFLENHGLIVGKETAEECIKTTDDINNKCKLWLENHIDSFVGFDSKVEMEHGEQYLFPDAAVLPEENKYVNTYLLSLMQNTFLTPKFLSDEEITKLNNLQSEKHRKTICK